MAPILTGSSASAVPAAQIWASPAPTATISAVYFMFVSSQRDDLERVACVPCNLHVETGRLQGRDSARQRPPGARQHLRQLLCPMAGSVPPVIELAQRRRLLC